MEINSLVQEYEKLKEKREKYEEDLGERTDKEREEDEKKFNSLPYY